MSRLASFARHGVFAGLLTGGALMATSVPSLAQCDSCVVGAVRNLQQDFGRRVDQNRKSVTQAIGQAQNAIVQALTQGTQQLSGYQTRTAKSQQRVEEAAQLNETIRQRQLARAEAEGGRYDPAASACVDLSGIMQLGGAQGSAVGLSGNDVINAGRNRSDGNAPAGDEVILGGMAIASGIVRDRDEYKGVAGVLDPTTDQRLYTDMLTLDTTDEEVQKALLRLEANIIDPTPGKPLTDNEGTTPAGRAQLASRQIDKARRSAARNIYGYLGNLAAPIGGDGLVEWARNAAPDSYPSEIGDVISTQQVMDIFVHSRFHNPQWHQELANMSPEAVNREIALTNALNLHINWMRFDLEKKVAAAIATDLSMRVDAQDSRSTAMPVTTAAASGPGPGP
ncbi:MULTISPECIES: hypothetical protein [unclassified Aurantimonas]|uniref:hypothetical protein n=1 Tax=unclassified Aurantimonas TaxID=2638230 RepID=UPI002E175898|nr:MULTISPECIES: hypothetical protein [unclassified Aurantimonas]MEC5291933.1 hypothetical protein [Aurantimonas sp. C2-3-R2]MEC5413019.1 hypothetical protein [Aurantimonas sp. C2-4-R8]